jgi:hypothetical protein
MAQAESHLSASRPSPYPFCRPSLQVVFQHSPSLSIWSTNDASFAEQRKARFLVDVKRAMA